MDVLNAYKNKFVILSTFINLHVVNLTRIVGKAFSTERETDRLGGRNLQNC